ncbi:MAG: hypothetical protein PHS57_06470 [Alphaproteobacteria bacterium]|nr:hypothetical protein [Alphaproteobacteria bacterium]
MSKNFTPHVAQDIALEDFMGIVDPEKLFAPNKQEIVADYRLLVKRFHPDVNDDPRAADAFRHAKTLCDRALQKLENGTWETPGVMRLRQKTGREATILYLKKRPFELGEMLICDGKLVFVVEKEFRDLAQNAVHAMGAFPFANDAMRDQFAPQLPVLEGTFQTDDGRTAVVVKRDNDLLLLQDVLEFMGGKIAPEHAAWIVSRLHNLACYFQWAGLVHNDISPMTVFIRPRDARAQGTAIGLNDHSAALLGGWWYAVKENEPYIGLPNRTLDAMPRAAFNDPMPKAAFKTDQTLLRMVGREIMGDPTGVHLVREKGVPKAMADWLMLPGSGDAFQDFSMWQSSVLKKSFGGRHFVAWDIKPHAVYPQP